MYTDIYMYIYIDIDIDIFQPVNYMFLNGQRMVSAK